MKIFWSTALLALFCTCPWLGAHAQSTDGAPFYDFQSNEAEQKDQVLSPVNPYDKKYKSVTGVDIRKTNDIASSGDIKARFARLPGGGPADVALELTMSGSVSGCVSMEQPDLNVTSENGKIKIVLDGGTVLPSDEPRYDQYSCNIRNGVSSAYVRLSKDDLIDQNIHEVFLIREGVGPLLRMRFDVTDENIAVISAGGVSNYMNKKKSGSGAEDQIFWFYPENTLVLYVPGSGESVENMVRLKTLARAKGLMPLEEIYNDFKPARENKGLVYVVDEKGLYAPALSDETRYSELGAIEVPETFYGPQGPYEKARQMKVFARKPGLYE